MLREATIRSKLHTSLIGNRWSLVRLLVVGGRLFFYNLISYKAIILPPSLAKWRDQTSRINHLKLCDHFAGDTTLNLVFQWVAYHQDDYSLVPSQGESTREYFHQKVLCSDGHSTTKTLVLWVLRLSSNSNSVWLCQLVFELLTSGLNTIYCVWNPKHKYKSNSWLLCV